MKRTSSVAKGSFVNDDGSTRHRVRKLIVAVLVISAAIHIIAGLGASIWVIARYFAQPRTQFVVQKTVKVDAEDRRHQLALEEVTSLRPKPVVNNRIQSLRPSKLALPELPRLPLDTIVPLDTEALIADQVDGVGRYGQGNGNGGGFFGESGTPTLPLLEGTFYDLKRKANGASSDIVVNGDSGRANHDLWLNRFINGGMRPNGLDQFFSAPNKVYLSQLMIPSIPADSAPRAFGIDAPGSNWVVVYRGSIAAPRDGTYRFAGSADDTLVVRYRGRVVLDGSWQHFTRWQSRERMSNLELPPETGMSPNSIVFGDWIQMKAGEFVPIQIMVGEQPGGLFSAALYIQERGVDYRLDGAGRPILPRFRVASKTPDVPNINRPYAADGPIFQARTEGSASGMSGL